MSASYNKDKPCPHCQHHLRRIEEPIRRPFPLVSTDYIITLKCMCRHCTLSDAFSKFSIAYLKSNGIMAPDPYHYLIFVEIDNEYYGLGFNKYMNSTEVVKFGEAPDEDGDYFPACKSVVLVNHIIEWDLYSVESAKEVICRLLKIKVFS